MRLIIIDDDPFARTVLSATATSLGHDVVAMASTAPEALMHARALKPEIALVDLDLGEGPTGIDVARGFRKILPNIAVVMLSTYSDPRLIGHNQSALPEGTEYLTKASVTDASVLGEALARAAGARIGAPTEAPAASMSISRIDRLSALQIELMRLVAAGHSNAEIARRRSITEQSVEKAVSRLIKDLGVQLGRSQNPRVTIAQTYFRLAGTVSERSD